MRNTEMPTLPARAALAGIRAAIPVAITAIAKLANRTTLSAMVDTMGHSCAIAYHLREGDADANGLGDDRFTLGADIWTSVLHVRFGP
jgi:hypothetical protein